MGIFSQVIGSGGTGFQVFVQSDNNPGYYADAAARDVYFGANPTELDRLDQNQFLIIRLADDGGGSVAYQQRASSTWVDVTSLIQGDAGPPGATGNSYFFESISARDVFFSTSPNEALLKNGLPVVVNIGNDTQSTFVWGGPDSPVSYNSTLWRLAAAEVAAGTLFLGIGGASISSGSYVLNFISADGSNKYLPSVEYDDTGSNHPSYWELPAVSSIPVATLSTQGLTDPQVISSTATFDMYVKSYTLIPHTSGEMRVQVWLGTDETGPNIVDHYQTVAPGDIGSQIPFQAPNNTLIRNGQATYTKFSGVQFRGDLQTSGPFIGQTVVFLTLTVWAATETYYITSFDNESLIFTSDETVFNENSADIDFRVESNTNTHAIFLDSLHGVVGINNDTPVNTFHVYDNNANEYGAVGVQIEQDGIGDAILQQHLTGGVYVTLGLDNDDSDKWKLSRGIDLNTDTVLEIDTSTGNVTFTGDVAANSITLETGTAPEYNFSTGVGLGVIIENATAGELAAFGLFTADGDGTDDLLYGVFAEGTPTDLSAATYIATGFDTSNAQYEMKSVIIGGGTAYDISLFTSGNQDQLVLDTGGDATFGGDVTVSGKLTVTGLIDPTGLVLTEQSAVPDTPAAGYGYLWVKDTTPSTFIFTDDAGTDHLIEASGGDVDGPASSTANYIAVFDDTTGKVIAQRSSAYIEDAGSNVYQTLGASGVGGAANFFFKDSVGGTGGVLGYNSTSGALTLDALDGILKLQGYGDIQMQIAQQGLLDVILTSTDDDEPAIRIDNSPVTYGAVFDWYFTNRTPVGNISAPPGSLCFRNNGNSSDMYLHRGTTTNNTDWVDIFETGSGDVDGPASSTDLSICTFDGTTGKLIQNNSTTTLLTGLSEAILKINASGDDGDSFIRLGDFGGTTLLEFHVDDDSNAVGITTYSTATAFAITNLATGIDTDITVTGNATIGLTATSANTNPPVKIGATGTDGATIQLFTSTAAPEGVITGNPGDLCIYKNGVSSGIYQLESASASNTGWATQGGNVDGPASSTQFAIAGYADTTGKLLINNPRAIIHDDSSLTELRLTSGGSGGDAKIKLFNYLNTELFEIDADDDSDTVSIEATSDSTSFIIANRATNVDMELVVTGNAAVDIVSPGANTNPPLRVASVGTNGAVIQFFTSTVSPEGVITGNPGDICYFKSGTSSRVFQLEAASAGNTGWVSQEGGDVSGPATTVVNTIPTWGDTTGNSLLANDTAYLTTSGSSTGLTLESPSASGLVSISLKDSNDALQLIMEYAESSDRSQILDYSGSGLDFGSDAGLMSCRSTSATDMFVDIETPSAFSGGSGLRVKASGGSNKVELLYDEAADESLLRDQSAVGLEIATDARVLIESTTDHDAELMTWATTGTNGSAFDIHVGNQDPNTVVTGSGGDMYHSISGATSSIYYHKGASPSTTWNKLLSTDEGAVTADTLAYFSDTSGANIASATWLRLYTGGNHTSFDILPLAAPGTSQIGCWDFAESNGVFFNWIDATDTGELDINDTGIHAKSGPAHSFIDIKSKNATTGSATLTLQNFADTKNISFYIDEGNNLQSMNIGDGISAESGATNSHLYVDSNSSSGFASIYLRNSSNSNKMYLRYAESSDNGSLTTATGVDLQFLLGASMWIGTPSGEKVTISSAGANTNSPLQLQTTGTDGANTHFFVSDVTPIGAITGDAGDICFRADDGIDSNMYIHKGASSNNTDWEKVLTKDERTLVYNIPVDGVDEDEFILIGEHRVVTTGETGDYATAFPCNNQHAAIEVNSITGSGDVTFTGVSMSESSGIPTATTEDVTVDATGKYQTDKKWLEITNIDIPAGITAIDYDVEVLGYLDMQNSDFTITGMRIDALASGNDANFSIHIIKIQDDGSKKCSLVDIEHYGYDAKDDEIVDDLRTGGDDRSYTATTSIWANETNACLKVSDYSTYFTSDENVLESSSKHEGIIIHLNGTGTDNLKNVALVNLHLTIEMN